MNSLKKLLEEVELTNKRHGLIAKNDSLVIGVSGGPDSVGLLYILCKMRRKYNLKLSAAHLSHGLLKTQSRYHLALVRKISNALELPFYSKEVRLKSIAAKTGRSLEEAGRIERYRFFTETAAKIHARKIVTAHTLDDQAETVLMRLLRGTGVRGLAGIPYKRREGECTIIRPLLDCSKKDVLLFLKKHKILYAIDKTNRNLDFTRNRVRHYLLPALERDFNPRIRESLASFQEIFGQTQTYIESEALRAYKKCVASETAGKKSVILLKVPILKKLHPAILREVLFIALSRKKGDARRVSHAHITAIESILKSSLKKNAEIHLPGPVLARKNGIQLALI